MFDVIDVGYPWTIGEAQPLVPISLIISTPGGSDFEGFHLKNVASLHIGGSTQAVSTLEVTGNARISQGLVVFGPRQLTGVAAAALNGGSVTSLGSTTSSVLRVGVTASTQVNGLIGGAGGRILYVSYFLNPGTTLTFTHESIFPPVENRINLPGGVSLVLTEDDSPGVLKFLHDNTTNRWILQR